MKAFEQFYMAHIPNHYNAHIVFTAADKKKYQEAAELCKREFERRIALICAAHTELAVLYICDMNDSYRYLAYLSSVHEPTLHFETLQICSMYIIYAMIAIPFADSLEQSRDIERELRFIEGNAWAIPARNELVKILESYVKHWSELIKDYDL